MVEGAENDLGSSDVAGGPGREGQVVVVRRGGWFQYEPADASHADHRWYLCSISMESEFMSYVLLPPKKNNDLSHLIPDSAAITRRPRGPEWKIGSWAKHEGNFVYAAPI